MEEESKISFLKKLKISIFGLEEYQKLALQKTRKTILYIVVLMLIFSFFLSFAFTYKFSETLNNVRTYIENNIEVLSFKDGKLFVEQKDSNSIKIEEDKLLNGKVIIDTSELSDEKVKEYTEEIKQYYNGVVILQDKIIIKTNMSGIPSTISLTDLANQFNLVKVEKQDILNVLSNNIIYVAGFVSIFIYLFIIYLSTVLLDAILYSLIGYVAGMMSGLKMMYKNVYNIAVHSLTLPIILNLIYMIINILTGYTIKYFSIMYTAIACIYVITAILMIKTDLIKKQMELSKIIKEQEKVRQELERKEQERREQEEKERVRKKDEEERKKQKDKSKKDGKDNNKKENQGPQPQANIKPINS